MGEYKKVLVNIITGMLVICALIITYLVLVHELYPTERQNQDSYVKNWQELELNGTRIGQKEAPVEIVEFFDYECPFCKKVQPAVSEIEEKFSTQITVVYEHYPIGGHQQAYKAAIAVECAARQGEGVFKSYHNLLFENQYQLAKISYDSLAMLSKIKDKKAFNICLENRETANIIESTMNLAEKLEISKIPTFIINGRQITGAISKERLEYLVSQALAENQN